MSDALTLPETVELHLDALYERDAAGMLLRARGHTEPSRVHFVRTVEGNRWLLGASLPMEARGGVEALLASEPVLSTIEAMERRPPACRDALLALLAEDRPPEREYCGPAYTFPHTLPEPSMSVEVLDGPAAARPHPGLAWLGEFTDEDRPAVIARDEAGDAVGCCHSTRLGVASAEAGLEVVEAYRWRGLARAVTLGWAQALRAGGRVPLYSTSWENEASRANARSLGLLVYAEDWHID